MHQHVLHSNMLFCFFGIFLEFLSCRLHQFVYSPECCKQRNLKLDLNKRGLMKCCENAALMTFLRKFLALLSVKSKMR